MILRPENCAECRFQQIRRVSIPQLSAEGWPWGPVCLLGLTEFVADVGQGNCPHGVKADRIIEEVEYGP